MCSIRTTTLWRKNFTAVFQLKHQSTECVYLQSSCEILITFHFYLDIEISPWYRNWYKCVLCGRLPFDWEKNFTTKPFLNFSFGLHRMCPLAYLTWVLFFFLPWYLIMSFQHANPQLPWHFEFHRMFWGSLFDPYQTFIKSYHGCYKTTMYQEKHFS